MRRVILSAFAAGLAGCSNPNPSSNPDTQSLVSAPAATPSVVAPIEKDQCDEWLGASTKDASITTLFNQIKKAIPPKSEFEPTADFKARAEAALSTINEGLLRRSGADVAIATHPIDPKLVSYNADLGRFKVPNYLKDRSFSVTKTETPMGTYLQKLSRTTLTIPRFANEEYGLWLNDALGGNDIEISVEPARAASMKGRLGLRVVGKLAVPGYLEELREGVFYDRVPAADAFNRRLDLNAMKVYRSIARRYVIVVPKCAAIVVGGTNEVLKRLK